MSRKYKNSMRIQLMDTSIGKVPFYVVDDLSDEELTEQFEYHLKRENYEYCQALTIEAERRGLKLSFI